MSERSRPFLIVTNKRDITSDFIVREFRNRGYDFYRLNTEDIGGLHLTQSGDKLGTLLSDGERDIELSLVRAAYFRRPETPSFSDKPLSSESTSYRVSEWSYLLRSLYLELGGRWFSHPNKIILGEDKVGQLRLARSLGFKTPQTIITNNKDDLEPLFEGGEVIAKPFFHALVQGERGDKDGVIFTSKIGDISDVGSENLSLAPVIFQRRIPKRYDIRVIVVADRVFATAIHSQAHPQTQTDWRHSDVDHLEHEQISLDGETSQRCIDLVKAMGLRYGAIDLIEDQAGHYWFLECNPNGQWAWIESRTGAKISEAIVDVMEEI